MTKLVYEYEFIQNAVENMGLSWSQEEAEKIDHVFHKMKLNQGEVNELIWQYVWRMRHYFDPKSYSFKQRLGLAWYFIRGKRIS